MWLRYDLQTFKRLAALERKRDEQLECGEIDTAHPGYLGSQDTFHVGNMKGVGRIYQQTFVDTYAKVAVPAGRGREVIETIRQGLKDDGYAVSISQLCRWFGIARRTVYYKPTKKRMRPADTH